MATTSLFYCNIIINVTLCDTQKLSYIQHSFAQYLSCFQYLLMCIFMLNTADVLNTTIKVLK